MTASVPSFCFDRLHSLQYIVLQARILDLASQNDWAAIR